MKVLLMLVSGVLAVSAAHARGIQMHEATPEEAARAIARNRAARVSERVAPPFAPVPEVTAYQYLLITGEHMFGDSTVKETIARNLPADMKLVVLVDPADADFKRQEFSQWIGADRLILARSESADEGFWARDAFPFPVIERADGAKGVVAAEYYRPFGGSRDVAASVSANVYSEQSFTFVGGNLQADGDGNCFSVKSQRLFALNESVLKAAYGCKTVTLLPWLSGIGDVDEVLKVLPGKRMLTNQASYRPTLEAMGYQVIMLPEAGGYRTHANSIILGNKAFMPVYGQASDAVATKVYQDLGYTVIPINTASLSDDVHGSLHCLSMAYPPMSAASLMKLIRARPIPR